jgi:hypothetical protein
MDLLLRTARAYWRMNLRAWPVAKEHAGLVVVLCAALLAIASAG